MQVHAAVDRFLRRLNPEPAGNTIVVAFSGGPDSTALLHSLSAASTRFRFRLIAAHLDHAIDCGSGPRARRAARLAEQIGVPLELERRSAPEARRPGESVESAARRIRYRFLREVSQRREASHIATAHQADDQKETVLLRLLFGSGIAGLAGIPAHRDEIIRPLLDVDRQAIDDYLNQHRLEAIIDPTNLDLAIPRNAIRHLLLPSLRENDAAIDDRLLALSQSARGAVAAVDRRLRNLLNPKQGASEISCDRSALANLPPELLSFAIGTLCRTLGAAPPTRPALADLQRQMRAASGLGCDLGAGWRVEDRAGTLFLHRSEAPTTPFAYTLTVPGEIGLPELSMVFRLYRCAVEPWMFQGSRRRAGMYLPLSDGDQVTIRSRRPGDRVQPLGCEYDRRLKEVLIDRKMPRQERDQLPLLCVGGKIVWVPGVTIDHEVRLGEGKQAWVAEIRSFV